MPVSVDNSYAFADERQSLIHLFAKNTDLFHDACLAFGEGDMTTSFIGDILDLYFPPTRACTIGFVSCIGILKGQSQYYGCTHTKAKKD